MQAFTDAEISAIAETEKNRVDTEGDQIVGFDDGMPIVLTQMVLKPEENPSLAFLTDEQVRQELNLACEKHCADIGWFPVGDGPDVLITKHEDGSWHAVMKLKQSFVNKKKDWRDFEHRVGVDGRTEEDVETSVISTGDKPVDNSSGIIT